MLIYLTDSQAEQAAAALRRFLSFARGEAPSIWLVAHQDGVRLAGITRHDRLAHELTGRVLSPGVLCLEPSDVLQLLQSVGSGEALVSREGRLLIASVRRDGAWIAAGAVPLAESCPREAARPAVPGPAVRARVDDRTAMWRTAEAVAFCLFLLLVPAVASAADTHVPVARMAAPAAATLEDLKVVRILDGAAVVEPADGELRVMRPGARLGDRGDEVVSVEPERIVLRGTRTEGGRVVSSWTVLTWDEDGRVRERRVETPSLDDVPGLVVPGSEEN